MFGSKWSKPIGIALYTLTPFLHGIIDPMGSDAVPRHSIPFHSVSLNVHNTLTPTDSTTLQSHTYIHKLWKWKSPFPFVLILFHSFFVFLYALLLLVALMNNIPIFQLESFDCSWWWRITLPFVIIAFDYNLFTYHFHTHTHSHCVVNCPVILPTLSFVLIVKFINVLWSM